MAGSDSEIEKKERKRARQVKKTEKEKGERIRNRIKNHLRMLDAEAFTIEFGAVRRFSLTCTASAIDFKVDSGSGSGLATPTTTTPRDAPLSACTA